MAAKDFPTLEAAIERLKAVPDDGDALNAFIGLLTPRATTVFRTLLRSRPNLLDDVVQDFVMKVVAKKTYMTVETADFMKYTFEMCRNHARSVHRKELNREALEGLGGFEGAGVDAVAADPDLVGRSEEEQLYARMTLAEMFGELSRKDQQVMRLVLEGYKTREIAKRTGLSCVAVGLRVWRAKKKLRKYMD